VGEAVGSSTYIHDIQFNYYGNRLATCSSDQTIAVWKKEGKDWQKTSEWKVCDLA
jgi:hypothetical protein